MNDILRSAIAAVDAALAPEGQAHGLPLGGYHSVASRRPLAENAKAASDAEIGIDLLLRERNAVHGDFTEDATLAQGFKDLMHTSRNWPALDTVKREALEHIATKIARILVGDPNHADHYTDIIGYCTLMKQRL